MPNFSAILAGKRKSPHDMAPLKSGSRFKVHGSRFTVQGSGFKVQGSRFRVDRV